MQVRPVPPKPHFVCDVAGPPQFGAHPTFYYEDRQVQTRERRIREQGIREAELREKRSQGADLRFSASS